MIYIGNKLICPRGNDDYFEAAAVDIAASIAAKGVAVPEGTKLDGFADLIDDITTGGFDVSASHFSGLPTNDLSDGITNVTAPSIPTVSHVGVVS